MDVAPKVFQGLWLPPSNASLNMASQDKSMAAIGLTQSVVDRVSKTLPTMDQRVPFSRSVRDEMVLTIFERINKIFQGHSLDERLGCFSVDLLRNITAVTGDAVCQMFETTTAPLRQSEDLPAVCREPPTDQEPTSDPEPDNSVQLQEEKPAEGPVSAPLPPSDAASTEALTQDLPHFAKSSTPNCPLSCDDPDTEASTSSLPQPTELPSDPPTDLKPSSDTESEPTAESDVKESPKEADCAALAANVQVTLSSKDSDVYGPLPVVMTTQPSTFPAIVTTQPAKMNKQSSSCQLSTSDENTNTRGFGSVFSWLRKNICFC